MRRSRASCCPVLILSVTGHQDSLVEHPPQTPFRLVKITVHVLTFSHFFWCRHGLLTGDYAILQFLMDHHCDLTCLKSLPQVVAKLVAPQIRTHKFDAAKKIQQWYRRIRQAQAVAACTATGVGSETTSADEKAAVIIQRWVRLHRSTVSKPPPPPPLPTRLGGRASIGRGAPIRCNDSVAAAALLLRRIAEQASEAVESVMPQRTVLLAKGTPVYNSDQAPRLPMVWKEACGLLASVLKATHDHFDEATENGRACRGIPGVAQSVDAIHQLASSPSVCRMLWYDCHEKSAKSTQLVLILQWSEEQCARQYMEAIRDAEFPAWLVKLLAEKLHPVVLREHAPMLLEALLDGASLSSCATIDTSKMSDRCLAKQQLTGNGVSPSSADLKTVTTLVTRCKGDDSGCATDSATTPAVQNLIGMLQASVNLKDIAEKQSIKNNQALRDAACAFMGACFPDLCRKCEVCFDPIETPTQCCLQTGGEHFRKVQCEHEYCKSCLESWIKANVEQQLHQITCPEEACKFVMFPDDVKRVLGDANPLYRKYIEYTTASYKERLHDFVTNAGSEWVRANTRLCPTCFVVIDRSAGCNSMLCTCGSRFNWQNGIRVTDKVIEEARLAAEAAEARDSASNF